MSDRTSLSGVSAALNVNHDIELAVGLGSNQRLTNDNLQGLKSKILIEGSLINSNVTGSGYQINSCYRFFSSASSIISCCVSHFNFPPS